jgi:hypothetical protein
MQIFRIDQEPGELDISPAYRPRPRKFLLAVAKQGDRCVWSASLEVKYPGSRTVGRTNLGERRLETNSLARTVLRQEEAWPC